MAHRHPEGITPSSGPYGAVFFMMTGMHAFHVITGLLFLMIVYRNARRGLYDQKNYPVEAAALLALRRPGLDLLLPGPLSDRCIDRRLVPLPLFAIKDARKR